MKYTTTIDYISEKATKITKNFIEQQINRILRAQWSTKINSQTTQKGNVGHSDAAGLIKPLGSSMSTEQWDTVYSRNQRSQKGINAEYKCSVLTFSHEIPIK